MPFAGGEDRVTTKEFTCIVCPNGCSIVADVEGEGAPVVARVRGNACKRGTEWARQEIEDPRRTISSSIVVSGGDFPLASVRTNRPVPLARIGDIMREIRRAALVAPVAIGDVAIRSPAGCDTDIIVTRAVRRRGSLEGIDAGESRRGSLPRAGELG
jgi:CxxC motif-containing protein